MNEINGLLEAWIDPLYHPAPHTGLNGKSPIRVWRDYVHQITPLGTFAHKLDELFYHRIKRKVRKDGSLSYAGKTFEVPYTLSQKTVIVVIEPHRKQALFVEDDQGHRLGEVTPIDRQANRHYKRAKAPESAPSTLNASASSLVELALEQQQSALSITDSSKPTHTEQQT